MYDPKRLKQDAEKLRHSRYFDETWYLENYTDVAMLHMDAAEHYLKYGTMMRRDPGPDFFTGFYADTHAKEIPKGTNPLLYHMEQKGGGVSLAPPATHILKAAQSFSWDRGYDDAIQLAEKYLPQELQYTSDILRANKSAEHQDETSWLKHINAYLQHFSLASISLSPDAGSLMTRLGTDVLPCVEDGPLVSVLMPAWNAKDTIRYSVSSILQQTWKHIELIIVDDASTDGTWDIIQQLAASDPRVTALRNSANAGPYVSKNIALTQARGDFITGHDADDWAHPQRIERHVRYMDTSGSPASLSGMLRMASTGEFVRFNPIGGLVHDGATRGAFISLMATAQYFHDVLGYWDQVRVGGDSELIRRIEKLQGHAIPILQEPTMLCLDNPEGLTNHPVLGHSESSGVSPIRRQYKNAFTQHHATIQKANSRIGFPLWKRPFPAPSDICASTDQLRVLIDDYSQRIALEKNVIADVVIATDFRLPGGNASSTLDEITTFIEAGLTVSLINCPVDDDLGKPLSKRYAPYTNLITNWSKLGRIDCKVFICRHPKVVVSSAFRHIAPKVHTDAAYIVKNNSSMRASGVPVYDIAELVAAAKHIQAEKLLFCPISPVMRAELLDARQKQGLDFTLTEENWTPTFDLALYKHAPKARMDPPFRVGRHGRDSHEKWIETPSLLRKAFPTSDDFRIRILGGAKNAKLILKKFPKNWEILDFGSIEPYQYLSELDVFAYFPNTRLSEGFGRTIVEAMLAGIPVILPARFSKTFDDLPLYAGPRNVETVVRRLSQNDTERVCYLKEVQDIAIARYSSTAIQRRFSGSGLWKEDSDSSQPLQKLTEASLSFRNRMMKDNPK